MVGFHDVTRLTTYLYLYLTIYLSIYLSCLLCAGHQLPPPRPQRSAGAICDHRLERPPAREGEIRFFGSERYQRSREPTTGTGAAYLRVTGRLYISPTRNLAAAGLRGHLGYGVWCDGPTAMPTVRLLSVAPRCSWRCSAGAGARTRSGPTCPRSTGVWRRAR
jgi:hypothetical protein